LKIKYLKILAGILFALILFEWASSIRKNIIFNRMEKTSSDKVVIANQIPRPQIKKTAPAIKIALFGDYVPDNVTAAGVKRSVLHMSVVGILFDVDETKSHVMLELPDHQVKSFGVGDSLPGNAVIKRITPEGILIMRDGVLESLSLPKNELFFSPPAEVLQEG
jgi:general secretion pathway protein C